MRITVIAMLPPCPPAPRPDYCYPRPSRDGLAPAGPGVPRHLSREGRSATSRPASRGEERCQRMMYFVARKVAKPVYWLLVLLESFT